MTINGKGDITDLPRNPVIGRSGGNAKSGSYFGPVPLHRKLDSSPRRRAVSGIHDSYQEGAGRGPSYNRSAKSNDQNRRSQKWPKSSGSRET
jgi:hypothetical protein